MIIRDAVVKGFSSFGVFFSVNKGELDVLTHVQELSYSRVNNPEELFSIGDRADLLVISVDESKLQVGCSIKRLSPDPFENISKYKVNSKYKVKIIKLLEFGAFVSLESGLTALLHASNISWTDKNPSAKKIFQVGQEIEVILTEIDLDKKRVAVSYKLATESPYLILEKKYPVSSLLEGTVSSTNEYSLRIKPDDPEISSLLIFVHCNDISYFGNPEEKLQTYKKGQKVTIKILEIQPDQQKARGSIKATKPDPISFFENKAVNDIVTTKVISSSSSGLIVRPEGCSMDFNIKKSQLSVNQADARPQRWVGGELLDVAIAELNLSKRKINLSLKLLEELQNKESLEKYGHSDSGKNLPFSSLDKSLSESKKNKKKTKKEE
jgi:small subunit ribosomal protein S1|tara:strand:- start:1018 stop:2160 length:1143 start_codon:yes stop_codon:yes gene_type:complete